MSNVNYTHGEIVMLPSGKAGVIEALYGTYARVRAWDASYATDFSYEYLQPWEDFDPEVQAQVVASRVKPNRPYAAVKGKTPGAHGRKPDHVHLTEDGDTTLCGLLVAHGIAHISPLRNVISCRNCTRSAKSVGRW